MEEDKRQHGRVYLIGAGPGDPKLLTLRGRECIQEADVIIYDYLANDRLLEDARTEAEVIFAGKRKGGQAYSQTQINQMMIEKARAGQVVARLKGGDPFIFGRGGEEALALADAGILFEVIPGVSSASGVPAYAGIPLTHRDLSAMVTLTTGHEDPAKSSSDIEWEKFSPGHGTLVFFMGITHLKNIVNHLIKHGRDPATPVAVICWGTCPEQETITGTLQGILDEVRSRHLALPGMVIVGEVVRLREKLNWFETRPLFGKRVLMTRPQERVSEFSEALARYGAEPVPFPTVKIVPAENWGPLDRALEQLETYHWIIFTSANGVDYFGQRLRAAGKDLRALGRCQVCAIGPKTAEALGQLGVVPDRVPHRYQAEGIIDVMGEAGVEGKRILIPRAREAREILPDSLRRMGAHVDVVTAYQAVPGEADRQEIIRQLEARKIAVVTFTSSSAVRNFVEQCGGSAVPALLDGICVASIGPITARTVQEAGLKNHVLPPFSTLVHLAEAIAEYFRKVPGSGQSCQTP